MRKNRELGDLKNSRSIIENMLSDSCCLGWEQERELKKELNKINEKIRILEEE